MAATRSTERLLAAAETAGAKVDRDRRFGAAMPSVQAGGWMREVGQRVGVHRLTQVMRQRDLGERRALAQLHDGRSDAYLDWATNQDRVIVHTDDAATSAALEDWKQAANGTRATVLQTGAQGVGDRDRRRAGPDAAGGVCG
jgi:hypothetical protein